MKFKRKGKKRRGGREQRDERRYQSSIEPGCESRETLCLPPIYSATTVLQRSQYQAFHPGATLAACSPSEDKDKPNLLHARMAAPAPTLPWKPHPGCNYSAIVGRQQHGTKCHSWPLYRIIQNNPLGGYLNELAATGLEWRQAAAES